jgi:copper chaperone CopZ
MSPLSANPNTATPFSIRVEGMAGESCMERVEKAIRATPGVVSASVNLATKRAEVVFSGVPDIAAVIAAIGGGFERRAGCRMALADRLSRLTPENSYQMTSTGFSRRRSFAAMLHSIAVGDSFFANLRETHEGLGSHGVDRRCSSALTR